MKERYSYNQFFQKLYHNQYQEYCFTAENKADAALWKENFRAVLRERLGLNTLVNIAGVAWENSDYGESAVLPEEGAHGCFQRKEATHEDGYSRYCFLMETLPDVFMPFYMLVPDCVTAQKPAPAMIALPAHGSNKDVVSGTIANDAVREKLILEPESAYGLEMVKEGYVVFCPDPPGYGERLEPPASEDIAFFGEYEENPMGSSCGKLAVTAQALGLSFQGLVIWDLMRLVDFISSRDDVKAGQIGCAGFSGGGQYAMWLAAMDERIQAVVISGYVHGFYESILDVHLCPCNYAPDLWKLCDLSDLCSLIAPRALFIENGIHDPENGCLGIEGPAEQVRRIRRAYEIYGKERNLEFVTPQGRHRWYGLCYDFLKKTIWIN